MFGDIMFAVVPFGTFDDGEDPTPYSQLWVNQCAEVANWEDQDPNELPTNICQEARQ